MKKKIIALVLALMAAVSVLVLGGCRKDTEEPFSFTESYDDVEYYGCPNSKRVKKLNLRKTR